MRHTKAFSLSFGGKCLWFDYHPRFLPTNHVFRRNKDSFRNGVKVTDLPPPRLSSTKVWNNDCDLSKFTYYGKTFKNQGYEDIHSWTKRSIFWDLPYCKDNLLRHNLGVMHIEKNSFLIMYLTHLWMSKEREKIMRRLEKTWNFCVIEKSWR